MRIIWVCIQCGPGHFIRFCCIVCRNTYIYTQSSVTGKQLYHSVKSGFRYRTMLYQLCRIESEIAGLKNMYSLRISFYFLFWESKIRWSGAVNVLVLFFFFTLEAQNLKHQRLVSLRLKSWICLKPFLVHGLIRQRIQLYTK